MQVLAVLKVGRAQGLFDDLDDIVSDVSDGSGSGGADGCGSMIGVTPGGTGGSGSASITDDTGGGGSTDAGSRSAGGCVRVPYALLQAAVGSRREGVRVDALQLICTNPRTSSLPGISTFEVEIWHLLQWLCKT